MYAKRVLRKDGPLLAIHPHAKQWAEFRSLFEDGVSFSRARAQGGSKQYTAVGGDTAVEKSQMARGGVKKEGSPKAKKSSKKHSKSSSSEEPRAPPPVADAGGGAEEQDAAPKSTAAGGSGRWVHLPS